MDFVFTGFRQVDNVRYYNFHGVAADRSETRFTIETDMAMLRKYSIALQDVPLLCRRLLEEQGSQPASMTFSEQEMRRYAETRSNARDAAALKRKAHRPVSGHKLGQAWRGPQHF